MDIIHKLLTQIIINIKDEKLIKRIQNYVNRKKYINEKEYLRIISYLPGPSPENSLLQKLPELAKQWHPTLNGKLTPYNVKAGVFKKVWWKFNF